MKKSIFNKPANVTKNYLKRLHDQWGFTKLDVIVVFLVFSLAGMASLTIRPYLQHFLPSRQGGAIAITVNVLIFSISYYLVLLLLGTIFGKGKFFLFMAGRPLRRLIYVYRFFKRKLHSTYKTILTILSSGKI